MKNVFVPDRPPASRPVPGHDSIFYAPDSQWHQSELDGAFDIGPLSAIGELDPTGENGILKEVLSSFAHALEPLLCLLELHREKCDPAGIRFETRRLGSAAKHMGAVHLSEACDGITDYFECNRFLSAPEELDALVDDVMAEVIRVQRKVRQLLANA